MKVLRETWDSVAAVGLAGVLIAVVIWLSCAMFASTPSGTYHLKYNTQAGIHAMQVKEHVPFLPDRTIFSGSMADAAKVYDYLGAKAKEGQPTRVKKLSQRDIVNM